jgi:hypothetical protein
VVTTRESRGPPRTALTVYDFRKGSHSVSNVPNLKGSVCSVAWEPSTGDDKPHLAVIVETQFGRNLRYLEVAKAVTKKAEYTTMGSLVKFSPAGRFAVTSDFGNVGSGRDTVQFYDMLGGLIKIVKIEGVGDLQWDSSGVFLLATKAISGMGGFEIYLLDGMKLLNHRASSFKIGVWRPRDNIGLTKEDFDAVKDELPAAIERYARFGVVDANVREQEIRQNRQAKMEKWLDFLTRDQGQAYEAIGKRPETFTFAVPLTRRDAEDINVKDI